MPTGGAKRKVEKSDEQGDDEEWVVDPNYEGPSWILCFGKGGAIEDDDTPGCTSQNKKKSKVETTSECGNKQKKKKSKQNKVNENGSQKHGQRKFRRGQARYQRGHTWDMSGYHGGRFGGDGNQWGGFGGGNQWRRFGGGVNQWGGFGGGVNQLGGFGGVNQWRGFGEGGNQWEGFGGGGNQWKGFGGGSYNREPFARGVWGGPQPLGCGRFDNCGGGYGEHGGDLPVKSTLGHPGLMFPPTANCNRGGQIPFEQENCYDDGWDDDDDDDGQYDAENTCPPFIWNPSTGELMPLNKDLDLDITKMSTLDRMKLFVNYLRNTKCNNQKYDSPVMVIENGLCLSKVGFQAHYDVELLMRFSGQAMFTGVLYVDEFFMARSVSVNKKQAKTDCYVRALNCLYKKPLQFLMSMTDVGAEAIRNGLGEIYQDLNLDTFPLEAQRVLDVLTQQASVGRKKFAKKAGLLNLESGLAKLINFLKYSNQVTPNAVCRVTQAFTSSKCNLSHDYEEDRIRLDTGQMWFKGRIYIGDIIVAGAGDFKKKITKEKTYQHAVDALLNKPLETILKGVSLLELDDAPPKSIMAGDPGLGVDMEKTTNRLEKLAVLLQQNTDNDDVVNRLDMACNTVQLTPTRLFRRGCGKPNECLVCELYLDNILIASGTGDKKKTAQQSAYANALNIIVSKKPEEIVSDTKQLTKEEMAQSDIMEISVKGQSRWGESNITKLNRLGIEPSLTPYGISDFVIMEHYDWSKDRTKYAFLILSQSATQNGMLLEWNMSPNGNLFKCLMRLQGQDIGDASASAKTSARNLAAVDALFQLYETQPVIRSLQRNETEYWNTYESIKMKAQELKQASGSQGDDPDEWVGCSEPVPGTPVDLKDMTAVEERDSVCQPVNKWVLQVLQTMLSRYAQTDTLDDLLFGPGLPLGERKKITLMCQELGLKYLARQLKDESYSAVFKMWSPQDMVAHLQAHDGASGKYILVARGELPTHSQGRAFILSQEQIARHKVDTWKLLQTHQTLPGAILNPRHVNPTTSNPVMNNPVANNPVMNPVLNNPTANSPMINYPITNSHMVSNPGMNGCTAYNSVAYNSATNISKTYNPATQIPMSSNPTKSNSKTYYPVTNLSMSSTYTTNIPKSYNPTTNYPVVINTATNVPLLASTLVNNPTTNNLMISNPTTYNTMMNNPTTSNPMNNPTTNNPMMNNPMSNPTTNNLVMNNPTANNPMMNSPMTNNPMMNNTTANNLMMNNPKDNTSFHTSTPKMDRNQQQPFFTQQAESMPEYVNGGVWKGQMDTPITTEFPVSSTIATDQQYSHGYVGGGEVDTSGTNSQFGTPLGVYNQTPSYHTANTSFQSLPGVYSSGASAYATPDGSNTHAMSSMYMSF